MALTCNFTIGQPVTARDVGPKGKYAGTFIVNGLLFMEDMEEVEYYARGPDVMGKRRDATGQLVDVVLPGVCHRFRSDEFNEAPSPFVMGTEYEVGDDVVVRVPGEDRGPAIVCGVRFDKKKGVTDELDRIRYPGVRFDKKKGVTNELYRVRYPDDRCEWHYVWHLARPAA